MSIFDIFSFKKHAQNVFSKENFQHVLSVAREAIISQIKATIPGQEKKGIVDEIVLATIDSKTVGCTNKLVLWLVELIKLRVPTVTQLVYDFLKEKIEQL